MYNSAIVIIKIVLIKSPIPTRVHVPLEYTTAPLPIRDANATLAFSIRLNPNSLAAKTPAATGTIYIHILDAVLIAAKKALCSAIPLINGEIIAPGVTATTIAIAMADKSLFQNSPNLYFLKSSNVLPPFGKWNTVPFSLW